MTNSFDVTGQYKRDKQANCYREQLKKETLELRGFDYQADVGLACAPVTRLYQFAKNAMLSRFRGNVTRALRRTSVCTMSPSDGRVTCRYRHT